MKHSVKQLLVIVVSAGLWSSAVAEELPKVAIVGDSALVDLVYAQLSAEENFELLERDKIRLILKERKLAAWNSSELIRQIPHADILVAFEPANAAAKRVIIFNVRNSYRMADFPLPDNTEQAAVATVARLRKSMTGQIRPATLTLGIVRVVDSGVPQRYQGKIDEFTSALEQAMGKAEWIVVLERNHLEQVNREREISREHFPLTPSACLIGLEFTPGKRPEITHCTVRLIDRNGKVLEKIHAENVFEDIPESVRKLIPVIQQKALKVVEEKNRAIQAGARTKAAVAEHEQQEEAKRYYETYLKLCSSRYQEAREALEAAIALAPDNQRYRAAHLRLGWEKSPEDPAEYLQYQQERLEEMRRYERNTKGQSYFASDSYFPLFARPFPKEFNREREYVGNRNPTEAEWLAEMKLAEEVREFFWKAGMTRLKGTEPANLCELYYYLGLIKRIYLAEQLYVDFESYKLAVRKGVRMGIEAVERYVNQYGYAETMKQRREFENLACPLYDRKLFEADPEGAVSTLEMAKRSPQQAIRKYAMVLEFAWRIRQLSPDTPESYRRVVEACYLEYRKQFKQNPNLFPWISGMPQIQREVLERILEEMEEKFWYLAPER